MRIVLMLFIFFLFHLITVATKLKGIDLDAPGNINGVSVVDVDMESFEEKPWRKPGTFKTI